MILQLEVCRNGDKDDFDTAYSRYAHADYNESMEMVSPESAGAQMAKFAGQTLTLPSQSITEEHAKRLRSASGYCELQYK